MLTQKRDLSARTKNISGYNKLVSLNKYHTNTTKNSFTQEILDDLKNGKIVIIDLSQGDPKIQQTFSEKICKSIFQDSMNLFVNNEPNNFIQFYFEEAHNLFPKKDDKDLSQIYNRIAKEGAKLNLGMIYATQEVSSISSNILKNTQNWFIAHLNNDDEIKEIRKFYDFEDFCESLIKYSSGSDKGFIRMKTYSNAFIVPVQIDRFTSEKKVEKKDEL
jgi:DNA helicase HerA-like ATPase